MDVTPKSSDGEMEPMQFSTGVTSSMLGKRKDPGESESDRESVDEYEEEEEDEEDSDYHWDKDSFDGQEYHSSDDDEDYVNDKDDVSMNRCYYRTVIKSKGFFEQTDGFPLRIWGGFGKVKDLDGKFKNGITVREFLINMAIDCVEKYNKKKNKNLRFHDFLRANCHPGGMTKYYITFAARESDSLDDPIVEYQAKVGRCGGKTYPILCRPSPPMNEV